MLLTENYTPEENRSTVEGNKQKVWDWEEEMALWCHEIKSLSCLCLRKHSTVSLLCRYVKMTGIQFYCKKSVLVSLHMCTNTCLRGRLCYCMHDIRLLSNVSSCMYKIEYKSFVTVHAKCVHWHMLWNWVKLRKFIPQVLVRGVSRSVSIAASVSVSPTHWHVEFITLHRHHHF